jgi:plasmid stabilization system protein ParE
MKLRILRPALEDLADGRRFYEMQGEGLGDYFFNSIFSEIDSLVLYGGVHSLHFGFHRLLAKRFPYAVYYRVMGDEAVVYRVLDCRREPRRIRKELLTGTR